MTGFKVSGRGTGRKTPSLPTVEPFEVGSSVLTPKGVTGVVISSTSGLTTIEIQMKTKKKELLYYTYKLKKA